MEVYVKSTGGPIQSNLTNINDRIVSGYYTGDNVDMYGHKIDPDGMLSAITDYKQWNTIREMHETPIGVAETIGVPTWNYITARIASSARGNEVLQLVKDGVYGAFSVGIIVTKAEWIPSSRVPSEYFSSLPSSIVKQIMDGGEVLHIREMELLEVSIVDRPANPMAKLQKYQSRLAGDSGLILPASYDLANRKNADKLIGFNMSMVVGEAAKKAIDGVGNVHEPEVIKEMDTNEIVGEVNSGEVADENEVVTKSVETSDQDVEIVAEQPVDAVANDEQEVVEDAVIEKSVAVETTGVDRTTELESVLIELSAKVNAISDAVNAISEALAGIENKQVEPAGINESEVEKIASAVHEKVIASIKETAVKPMRKYATGTQEEPVDQKIDVKTIDTKSLTKIIANAAVAR